MVHNEIGTFIRLAFFRFSLIPSESDSIGGRTEGSKKERREKGRKEGRVGMGKQEA